MGRHPLDAAALEAAPRPRARALVARLARDRAAAAHGHVGRSPSTRRPTRRSVYFPGLSVESDARRLRLHPLPQRPRAGAARLRLRRRLHGRLLAAPGRRGLLRHLALDPRQGRPARDRLRRRRHRLLARHPGLGARQRRVLPLGAGSTSRPRCCCSASRRTRCPSCSRSSSRSPPGRSPPAGRPGTSCSPPPSSPSRSRSRSSSSPPPSRPGSRRACCIARGVTRPYRWTPRYTF